MIYTRESKVRPCPYVNRHPFMWIRSTVVMSAKSIVGALIPVPLKLRSKLRVQHVSMNVNHIYGPRTLQLSRSEAAVTCVLRNGEYYIDSFVQHYSKMGFRHIFFLDNGSSDITLSIAKQ